MVKPKATGLCNLVEENIQVLAEETGGISQSHQNGILRKIFGRWNVSCLRLRTVLASDVDTSCDTAHHIE